MRFVDKAPGHDWWKSHVTDWFATILIFLFAPFAIALGVGIVVMVVVVVVGFPIIFLKEYRKPREKKATHSQGVPLSEFDKDAC
jgi:hypothetical protein